MDRAVALAAMAALGLEEKTERCWICGKPKGQPPERCPGHYEGLKP